MLPAFLGPVIGFGIIVSLTLFFSAPLIMAALMARGRVRYREPLAALTLLVACAFAAFGGNYFYNLLHWTKSRPSDVAAAFTCLLLFGSPFAVLAVIVARTAHRRWWAAAAFVLFSATTMSIVDQVRARGRRDAEERHVADARADAQVVARSLSAFLPAEWVWSRLDSKLLLRGHVPTGVPVTLLSDPAVAPFKAERCTVITGIYVPKDPDPAVRSDVTYLVDAASCALTHNYTLAAIGRHARHAAAVPFAATGAPVDGRIFSSPLVTEGLRPGAIPLSGMDIAGARAQGATGPHGEKVFVVTVAPFKAAESAFPCSDPALVLSVDDVTAVQAALPPCTLGFNLFTLDDDLFFAARTQTPTPRHEEVMNPDWVDWLFRVTPSGVGQIWPPAAITTGGRAPQKP